jgi:hypothetical protein
MRFLDLDPYQKADHAEQQRRQRCRAPGEQTSPGTSRQRLVDLMVIGFFVRERIHVLLSSEGCRRGCAGYSKRSASIGRIRAARPAG